MENVLLIILLIVALCLIVTVLLQRSEGGGLGLGGGGGGGGGVMSGRSAATALGTMTWIFGIGFFIVSLALTVITAQKSSGGSVIDQLGGSIPAATLADPLEGQGTLLPPSSTDAPLVPGRADEAGTTPVSE